MAGVLDTLIIIDIQNDFCPGGALAVPKGDTIIPTINRVAPRFRVVVATKDWHPAAHISFADTHPNRSVGETVATNYGTQRLWPVHCVQGSRGAEVHPSLALAPVHLVVHKGYNPQCDSYSCFFDSNRAPTGLAAWLQSRGTQEIYLCGLATDYCVLSSALDSVSLSFKTRVISDAIQGVNAPPGSVAAALNTMNSIGVSLVDSADLFS